MRKLIRLTCVFAFGAWTLSAQSVPVSATVQTTGMVGIGYGQTAQFNLLNPGVDAPAVGVVCTASVSFVDAAGAVLKTAALTIAPGTSQALELHSDSDLNLPVNGRREIRATVTTPALIPIPTAIVASPGALPGASQGCTLIPTLEMIDTSSGRTLVVLGHVTTVPSVTATTQPN
jgi:hypothetical protein